MFPAKGLPPLAMRLVLAYSFYTPAMKKLENIDGIAMWFGKMGIPAPTLNAYLTTFTEALGVILLVLELGTRYIAFPLIITMLVAIFMVHWDNGFLAAKNGFQIPFYFIITLLTLLINGSGKISLDHLIGKKLKQIEK